MLENENNIHRAEGRIYQSQVEYCCRDNYHVSIMSVPRVVSQRFLQCMLVLVLVMMIMTMMMIIMMVTTMMMLLLLLTTTTRCLLGQQLRKSIQISHFWCLTVLCQCPNYIYIQINRIIIDYRDLCLGIIIKMRNSRLSRPDKDEETEANQLRQRRIPGQQRTQAR